MPRLDVTSLFFGPNSNPDIYKLDIEADGTVREAYSLRDLGGNVLTTYEHTYQEPDDPAWQWTKDYVYRGSQLLAALVPDGQGGETKHHYMLDHLGTPTILTNDQGALAEPPNWYWAYGERMNGPVDRKMQFTGHERDRHGSTSDDLDYMHARFCSPYLGRFMSIDPARSGLATRPASWNRYSYAKNNPINRVDPDGREDEDPEMVKLPEGQFAIVLDFRRPESSTPELRAASLILSGASKLAVPPGARGVGAAVSNLNRARFGRKLDFLFDRNIDPSNAASAARASGNAKALKEGAGIIDTPANRKAITEYINKAVNDPTSITKTVGERNTRQILVPGPSQGAVVIDFVEENGRIITMTAKTSKK